MEHCAWNTVHGTLCMEHCAWIVSVHGGCKNHRKLTNWVHFYPLEAAPSGTTSNRSQKMPRLGATRKDKRS